MVQNFQIFSSLEKCQVHTRFLILKSGGMAEWSKAADLRSVGRLSARVRTSLPSLFFYFICGMYFVWPTSILNRDSKRYTITNKHSI